MNAHFSPFMSSRTTSPGRISGTSRGVGVGGGGAPATPPSSSIVVVVVVVVVATRRATRDVRRATRLPTAVRDDARAFLRGLGDGLLSSRRLARGVVVVAMLAW
jgi:hypothetical protein